MITRYLPLLFALCAAFPLLTGCSRDSKVAKYQQRAEAHFKSGDYDRAEIEYKNLLRLDPTNRVAVRNLSLMAFEQGQSARAYVLLSNARKLLPEDYEVRLRHAQLLLASGKPAEAREEAIALIARQPTNQDALLLLVESSAGTNDFVDAGRRLASLKSDSGGVAGYHVALGSWHFRNRDTNSATAAFRSALALDPRSSAAHLALGGLYSLSRDTNNALSEFKAAAELAPPRSVYAVRYADYLMALGDLTAAREFLENVSRQTPDYLPALMRQAQLALVEQRLADCEGVLKTVLSRDNAHLEGMLLLARLRVLQNQPAQSIVELERVLQIFPRLPLAHFQIAVAHLMLNDLPRATKALNDALAMQPDYPEATMLLAELSIRRGDTAYAVNVLSRLLERRPGLNQAQLLLATAHRAAGNLDSALRIYERISHTFPTNPQPALLMGLVQRQLGKKTEARASFEKAVSFAPSFFAATEQLINMDLDEQRFAAAMERARSEVNRDPTNAIPLLLVAKVHVAETNLDAAEKVLLKALEVSPGFSLAQNLLAQVYVAAKKHPAALEQLQAVVAHNTNDIASWMMIAELNSAASNYVAARAAYESILVVNPRAATALNNLAWLSSEHLNDPKRAYELASRARELQPRNPFTADTFGWVLYKNGDYARALALLQESAKELPGQPEVLFHLGMTHYMMGEESAARVALQNAIQLASADALWRAEAAERLRILDFDPASAGAAAIKEMESLAARSSQDPILLARLGAIAAREGAWDRAAKAYENALQWNTNLVPVMVNLAQLYSTQLKNPDRAFALARRARTLEPDDPRIAHTLGSLAYASAQSASDFQWAQGLLQESARALPDDAEVLFDMASATYAVGDVTNAISVMEKVVSLRATPARQAEATRFLEMNRLLGQPAEATASAAKVAAVLQQQPDYVPALCVHAMLLESGNDYPAARDVYERILKLRPRFAPAHKSLARIFAEKLKDAQKAYDHATKARESYPQDPQVARVLGGLAYQRGELPRAVQLLKESVPAFADDAELFYTLGLAHYQLKQSRESKEALNKALAMSPDSPLAPEARKIVAELK